MATGCLPCGCPAALGSMARVNTALGRRRREHAEPRFAVQRPRASMLRRVEGPRHTADASLFFAHHLHLALEMRRMFPKPLKRKYPKITFNITVYQVTFQKHAEKKIFDQGYVTLGNFYLLYGF